MPSIFSGEVKKKSFEEFHGADFVDCEEVGWGFSGLVLRSLHIPTKRTFARKIIHETPRKRKELSVLTHSEWEFYAKLQSRHIVECFGTLPLGETGHIHGGLVFEFMDLGSLCDLLSKRSHAPFPEPVILSIAASLLEACEHLESAGIVHRDIKPSNILFNSRGEVKVCDFGEACYGWESESRVCEYGRMAGSTAYMSPERLMCQTHSNPADIWSLGLVLLELTCPCFPFATRLSDSSGESFDEGSSFPKGEGCSLIELWESVMELDNLPQVSTEGYSAELAHLVQLCMIKDPKERPTAGELLKRFSLKGRASPEQLVKFITCK
jgi:mitogen-activated protein kinase kinase